MRIALIGVPTNSSGRTDGVARAPAALRAAGVVEALGRHADVVDLGDLALPPPSPLRDEISGIIDPHSLETMVLAVQAGVAQALEAGMFPLVLGGDCPLLLGCLAAARAAHGRSGLLFVDGHEDAWPPRQSPTGEAADMELGLALGLTDAPALPRLAALLPLLQADDVWLLGPRDAGELRDAGVPSIAAEPSLAPGRHCIEAATLEGEDGAAITRQAVEELRRTAGSWWLHLDLDVLATAALPAVDYPQPGGLLWPAFEAIAATALGERSVMGCNVTIYNPDLDPDRSGAARIVRFLGEVIGERVAARV